MVSRVRTVAFQGIEAVPVDVQVMIAPGKVNMHIVGLPDKAVAESRERVQAALHASGLSMPAKKVTVNLAPADLPKEGSHYDLPIALGLMAALGAIPGDALSAYVVLGELSLDGTIAAVAGALPAAIGANAARQGADLPVGFRARSGLGGRRHRHPRAAQPDRHRQSFPRHAGAVAAGGQHPCAGRRPARPCRHQGPGERQARARSSGGRRPQSADGRAARIRQIDAGAAAAVDPAAAVAQGTARSLDGRLDRRRARPAASSPTAGRSARRIIRRRWRRWSAAACACGRAKCRSPITACCSSTNFPEFSPQVLDSLRQPIEAGECMIARANTRVTYPARIQLVAAMNPCRCGMAGEPGYRCARGPRCQTDYQARISGPLLDRIDLRIEVPAVSASDLIRPGKCRAQRGGRGARGAARDDPARALRAAGDSASPPMRIARRR